MVPADSGPAVAENPALPAETAETARCVLCREPTTNLVNGEPWHSWCVEPEPEPEPEPELAEPVAGREPDPLAILGGRHVEPEREPVHDARRYGPVDETTAQHWAHAYLSRPIREWCEQTGRNVPGGPTTLAGAPDPATRTIGASPAHVAVLRDYLACHPPQSRPLEAEVRALLLGGPELAAGTPAETAPADAPAPAPKTAQGISEPPPDGAERRSPADMPGADELAAFTRSVRKLRPDANDDDLADALAIFHQVTAGIRWVSYAGQTGQAWFARDLARYASMTAPAPLASEQAREAAKSGPLTRINFVAKGRKVRAGMHVTGFDVNGQHLAAAGSVELGDGEPETASNPRTLGGLVNLPGYVRLARPLRTGHPAFGTRPAGEWVAMPLVKFLAVDLGLTVEAAEVLYWPRKGRRLATYVKRYRVARDRLAEMEQTAPVRLAAAALKDQAVAFVGMFHSETYSHGGYYRPDWYDMTVATAEANALRAFRKCDAQPVAKMADTAYWVADRAPFTPDGLTVSAQLGKWKLERWGPVTGQFLEAYKSGQPRSVHEAVKAADDERRAQ